LIRAASKCDARLVWVSYSSDIDQRQLEQQVDEIAAGVGEQGADLVVGGRQIGLLNNPRFEQDNVHVVSSMHELALFAKGLSRQTASRRQGN
jgi:hypothetical protein